MTVNLRTCRSRLELIILCSDAHPIAPEKAQLENSGDTCIKINLLIKLTCDIYIVAAL